MEEKKKAKIKIIIPVLIIAIVLTIFIVIIILNTDNSKNYVESKGPKEVKNEFEILTNEVYLYVAQKFDIADYLEYSDNTLKYSKVEIIEGKIDILNSGTYPIKVEVMAQSGAKVKKDINVIVSDFEYLQEVNDYANDIISKNYYSKLSAFTDDDYKNITISNEKMTKIIDNRDFISVKFNLKSSIALISSTIVKNALVLSKDNYYLTMVVEIEKRNIPLDTDNWYANKSFIITSDTGSYELKESDSKLISNHDRSSNYGSIQEPKYTLTSKLGYIINDIPNFYNVINGNNINVMLILAKGLDESGEEEKIEISLSDDEVKSLKEFSDFLKDYIYEL